MEDKTNNKYIFYIIGLAFLARMLFLVFFVDLKSSNYWEFGYIGENLKAGKGYSLFYFTDDKLNQIYDSNSTPYPSAFMPPVYVYYLYPFLFIDNDVSRNILLIFSQIIISLITIFLLYKFCIKYFSKNIALISSLIIAIVPEFIYITTIFNAVNHYHLFIICFFMLILSKDIFHNKRKIFLFSLFASMLILLRSEFVLFLAFVYIILLIKRKFSFTFTSAILIMLFISPWIIRNAIVFDDFIPLSTSGGLNFYRGHNPERIGYWGDEYFLSEIKVNTSGNNFELMYNDYYYNKAFNFAKENPVQEIKNSFLKVYHLWIFNTNDKRSFNPGYMIPSLIIIIFSILGIIKSFNLRKYYIIYIFILSATLTAILFFALPRYQIMMKIALIPFCSLYMEQLFNRIKRKNVIISYKYLKKR
jgi:hypothetical protein